MASPSISVSRYAMQRPYQLIREQIVKQISEIKKINAFTVRCNLTPLSRLLIGETCSQRASGEQWTEVGMKSKQFDCKTFEFVFRASRSEEKKNAIKGQEVGSSVIKMKRD